MPPSSLASIGPATLEQRAALVLGAVFIAGLPVPGTVALRLICLALLALLALAALVRERPPRVPLALAAAFAVWVVAAFVSLHAAVDTAYSLREIQNEVGYGLIAFWAFFLLARDFSYYVILRNVLLVVAGLLAAVAIAWRAVYPPEQFYDGPFGGPGSLALLLLIALGFALVALQSGAADRLPAWLVLALSALLAAGAFATRNRIIWIVVLLVVAFCWLLARFREPGGSRLRLGARGVIVTLAGALLALAASYAMIQQATQGRMAEGGNAESAELLTLRGDPRLPLWAYATERVLDGPVTGHGFGRGALRKDLVEKLGEPMLWHGHNVFLNYAIMMGPLGPLVLLGLVAALVREHWRAFRADDPRRRTLGFAGLVFLFAFFARSSVDDFFYRHGALLFWALNGLLIGVAVRLERGANHAPRAPG